MPDFLKDMLGGRDMEARASRVFGVVTAVVTNNKDPEKKGRCKVKMAWLSDKKDDESDWIRISTLMAGKERGSWFLPELEDEVLIAFEHGDIHKPYIIGALWQKVDMPPITDDLCAATGEDNARGSGQIVKFKSPDNSPYKTKDKDRNENGKNDIRFIRSRSGHMIMLDDTKGEERITIIDKTYKHRISIYSKTKKIVLTSEDGDIEMYAPKGTIYMEAKNIEAISEKAMKLESKDTFDTFSKGKMKVETKDTMDLISQGKMKMETKNSMEVKASQAIKQESGSTTDMKAGPSMKLKATKIDLN